MEVEVLGTAQLETTAGQFCPTWNRAPILCMYVLCVCMYQIGQLETPLRSILQEFSFPLLELSLLEIRNNSTLLSAINGRLQITRSTGLAVLDLCAHTFQHEVSAWKWAEEKNIPAWAREEERWDLNSKYKILPCYNWEFVFSLCPHLYLYL